jgi:hypothetical protein
LSNSHFSELFARSADIYAAIKAVMARSKQRGDPIDPTEVVTELIEHYPATSLSPAALLEEVVRAAADAGVALKVKSPE